MQHFYTLTAPAVKEAAIILMEQNGTTTTLEVKQFLRAQGYWALQADVSVCMQQLARANGWAFLDTGRFRIYFTDDSCDPELTALIGDFYLN